MANLKQIHLAFENYSKRIEDLKVFLSAPELHVRLADTKTKKAKLACFAKSSVYVFLASALESFIEDLHQAILLELEKRNIQKRTCNPMFHVFANVAALDALKDVRGHKMWQRRKELFTGNRTPDPITFPNKCVPLDGKTIKANHIEALWTMYGFDGHYLPGHAHKLALADVAENRNALAHGRTDPVSKGRSLNSTDLDTLTEHYLEIGEHLYCASTDFFSAGKHLAKNVSS